MADGSIPIFVDFPEQLDWRKQACSAPDNDSFFGSLSPGSLFPSPSHLFPNWYSTSNGGSRCSTPRPEDGALDGIKILDFSRLIAGPFATMLLSDMGAEVWKVERMGMGDETRAYKPPSVNDESCYFMAFNRNKKSIAIDIKKPEGKKVILELVKKADVLVENFLPQTMERAGLGWNDLKQINPQLIYCSISGYGSTGPWANRGGFDVIAAAIGGYMNITGTKGGEPVKSGLAVTDMLTAMYAHGAILAALFHRSRTGHGQKIECSLLNTQVSVLSNIASGYLNTGREPQKWGTDHETIVPYRGFKCADEKWLIIGAGNDRQWNEFCEIIELPQLYNDERFHTNPDRVRNRDELMQILEERFLSKTMLEWSAKFDKTTLPYGPINNMEDTFKHPQVVHNGILQTVHHPTAGEIKMTGPAVKFSKCENRIRSAPPTLGQHTVEVLREVLDMDEDQIEEMKKSKAVQ